MDKHIRRDIAVFKLFTFWFWFSNYILTPYMSPYARDMGASNVVIGFVVSAYSVAQIALKIPLGIASDRMNKKKQFIVAGAAITLASEVGMFLASSVGGLIAFRLLQGIAVAAWVCATVLFASYLPKEQAVNATVQLQIFNSAGTLTGYLIGGFVTTRFGYRSVFLLATMGAVLAFIASLFVHESPSSEKPISTTELVKVGKSPFLLFVTGVCMIGQMILASTTWGFTPTLAIDMGADAFKVSLISISTSVAGLMCSLFVSRRIVAKFGEKRVIILATAAEALFCVMQPFMPGLAMLGASAAVSGFSHAMSYSVLLGLSIKHFPGKTRAAAMGFMQSLYCIGLFVGPVVFGFVSDLLGMRAGFVTVGLIGFIAPVVTHLFFDKSEVATLHQMEALSAAPAPPMP